MSSSSSSGYSDEDAEAPPGAAAPSASALSQAVELAQISSFCTTFRAPLRLPSFSRTELQEALLGASNGDRTHVELLAELHFKLAREHPTAKMEKMVQDWEKTLARKLQENWRKEFTANPMGGGVSYRDLTVFERVKILDALCHWKLDTCAEIHKHITTLQKENDNNAIKKLRGGEIGTDDNGVSYWYFDDGCWIYAEDKPRWQLEERKPSYVVEFANAKRIRLSINFDPDHNSSAPPIRLPVKTVAFSDDVKEHKKVKKEEHLESVKDDRGDARSLPKSNVMVDGDSSQRVQTENEQGSPDLFKSERQEAMLSVEAKTLSGASTDGTPAVVKGKASSPIAQRMDINMLCASVSPSSEEGDRKRGAHSHQSTGSVLKQSGEGSNKLEATGALHDVAKTATPPVSQAVQDTSANPGGDKANENNSGEPGRPGVVISKKRTIIDDDSSDSTCDADADATAAKMDKKMEHQAASSPPPRKKRKASIENTDTVALTVKKSKDDSTKISTAEVNGTRTQVPIVELVAADVKEVRSAASTAEPAAAAPAVADVQEANSASATKDENEVTSKVDEDKNAGVMMTDDPTNPVKLSGPASTSPTDPAAAPEVFDITCESCKKCYDMRYLDPPLVERPTDEWRCFECLVNDARGWPRRRKSIPREPFSPRADGRGEESSSKKRGSSSKTRSSSKNSKKSSSKSRSSSSSKKKSSRSSSSKPKSSRSKSSSSKKSSSSSSSKKHKKRKSSSSSHHHSSSHSHHHRRRHHSHYHHEEFAKLVGLFRERQEKRFGIEEARIKGELEVAFDGAPQGWRVVSSTLEDLQALILSLLGGSLEQDRLRGRLILISKDQEKREEQRIKQQELAWNILPRRQSSRIAIGRMKNQSALDSDAEDGYSDDDAESRRPGLRSRRSHSTTSDGADGKQKHDRAWRARRRHQISDDDMDPDDEDDEVDSNGVPVPSAGDWIDWSLLKENSRRLSTVCLALVNRLLKEEAAELFARPVDPELDGCPNYLSVINHPMDLGTIRSRVESSSYRKWKLFKKDVELVWQNCRTFNAPDTMVVQFADLLAKLSRSMCLAAEKKGVDRMKDKGSGGDESDHASEDSSSDASKAESRGSVNKAWTESSASESSESSDGDSSPGGDSDALNRKRRSSRRSSKKPPTHSRSTRSSRTGRSAATRASRSTRSRSSKKRPAPTSSSEDESSASENEEVFSPVRTSRQPLRGSAPKTDSKMDPPTEDEDSSDDDRASNQPPPPQNGAPSPPPPPPPQAVQKRPKPRLIISDSSSSDDSSDSNSSSSSSSDSDDSDSDTRETASKQPQPPPPSTAEVSAPTPPPPSPPPPTASPVDDKPQVQSTPKKSSSKPKAGVSHGRKAKTPSAAKTGSGYTHSPPLLNSYLSPSSSSSSDFSSGDSESSDGDSDDSD